MTASDVERRLADLLRDRAEEAMQQTDTEEQRTLLITEGEQDQRRRQRARYVAIAVAAAAVVAAFTFTRGGEDRADVPPADHVPTESEALAARFLVAVSAGDVRGAEGMLADGAKPDGGDVEAWAAEVAWNGSNGSTLVAHRCRESGSTPAGTTVACEYSRHGLASAAWGLGPYDGTYLVTVRDGAVVEASDEFPFAFNGYNNEVWGPFASFVADRSLRHAEAMYTDLTFTAPRTDDRALELWERYVAAYARQASKG
ncbi:MAG TPA: hypothetical protein VFK52_07110 [Nocardioidaceae bacterium]|nr:hypothetical protein [Nocardioidaceae bacterium]